MADNNVADDEEVYLTKLTPLTFLERSAEVFREKAAVIHGNTSYTYPQMHSRVKRLASALRRAGIQKGDRVAFLSPNVPSLLEAHYGVPLAGAVLVAINTRLEAGEIEYILNHSGSKILFVDTELTRLITPIQANIETVKTFVNLVDTEAGAPGAPLADAGDYERFLETGSEELLGSWLESENDTISINYTSGTTGRPKGVMYTHRGGYLNGLGECLEMGINSRSVYLWTLPMFHCNGWCFTWGVTAVGATHVCLRKVEPAKVIELIQTQRVSHFCGAPTVLISLVNAPEIKRLKLERPLRVTVAGAPPSPTVIRQMEEIGTGVTHVYGLTETYGPHTICEWQEQWDELPVEERYRLKGRQGVGYITVGNETMVVNENNQPLPRDGESIGEVVMRGNNVMKGYFADPQATEKAFRGGWFHSGDIGVMNADGYLEIRDRQKDIIISGGENISTVQIERVVDQHPAVMEVAVIAIPDPKWGEVPKAFVTLKEGQSATEQEIIDFCRQRLAHFKCPKAITFGPLPKTSTGKIQKYVLREKEWAGYDKRVH